MNERYPGVLSAAALADLPPLSAELPNLSIVEAAEVAAVCANAAAAAARSLQARELRRGKRDPSSYALALEASVRARDAATEALRALRAAYATTRRNTHAARAAAQTSLLDEILAAADSSIQPTTESPP